MSTTEKVGVRSTKKTRELLMLNKEWLLTLRNAIWSQTTAGLIAHSTREVVSRINRIGEWEAGEIGFSDVYDPIFGTEHELQAHFNRERKILYKTGSKITLKKVMGSPKQVPASHWAQTLLQINDLNKTRLAERGMSVHPASFKIRLLRKNLCTSAPLVRYTLCRGAEEIDAVSPLDAPPVFREMLRDLRGVISHKRNRARLHNDEHLKRLPNKPGRILGLIKEKLKRSLRDDKKPATQENHVGVELEFCSPQSYKELSDALYDAGLSSVITIKEDGSLRTSCETDYTHEVCILAPEADYKTLVSKACGIILSGGGYVNKTCGLHVHLDMRNRDVALSYTRLLRSLNILYAMVPATRQTNKFCKRNPMSTPYSDAPTDERYWAINAGAFVKHKTLENRLHSGSLDADRINNWVSVLLWVVENEVKLTYKTPKYFFRDLGMPKPMIKYISDNIRLFSTDEVDHDPEHVENIERVPALKKGRGCSCPICVQLKRNSTEFVGVA